MEELKENVISLDIKQIATKTFQLSIFVALAIIAPYFLNQLITGSIVNALLFISASILGLESAFFLCLIPSLISIYTGLLPLALAPMIPYIITGNALLVLTFSKLKGKGFWLGAVSASLIKFIFIWSAGYILVHSVLTGSVAKSVLIMISWPQLVTAISGAAIAYFVLKLIKKI